jgi:triacylglycerol lipase
MSNISVIKDMLNLSKLIYSDDIKRDPNTRFVSNRDTDLQCGVRIDDFNARICVIFRGSESSTDWYYDLHNVKKQIKGNIYVHGGFYDQLRPSLNLLINMVTGLMDQYPYYSIYITGHSLGGALSTLFGYYISHETDREINVISFASPRVGNSSWRDSFKSKENLNHTRVTNKHDPVPHFPIFFYYHTGVNFLLKDSNESNLIIFNVEDHKCSEYIKRLNDTI